LNRRLSDSHVGYYPLCDRGQRSVWCFRLVLPCFTPRIQAWSPARNRWKTFLALFALRYRWRAHFVLHSIRARASRLRRLHFFLPLFSHALVNVARANERQRLVQNRRSSRRNSSCVWHWAARHKTAFPGWTFHAGRRFRTARCIQRLWDLPWVAELAHAETSFIWAPAMLARTVAASSGTGVAFRLVDRSARAELPSLGIHTAIEA
jgi:hypothetical protein